MFAKNWFPKPSPVLAPFTRPAMSTNSTVVGTMFTVFEILDSTRSRSSGTVQMPVLGSMVQNGKFAAWAWPFLTMALKRVDLPTLGSPTIPVLRAEVATRLEIWEPVVSNVDS
jgi:hypothetical protein